MLFDLEQTEYDNIAAFLKLPPEEQDKILDKAMEIAEKEKQD